MTLSKLVDSESGFQKVIGQDTKFLFSREYLGISLFLRVDLGAQGLVLKFCDRCYPIFCHGTFQGPQIHQLAKVAAICVDSVSNELREIWVSPLFQASKCFTVEKKKRPQPYAKQLVASNEESLYNSTSSIFHNQIAPTLQGERNLNLWHNFVKISRWCSFNFMHNIYTQRRRHWLQRLYSLFKFFFGLVVLLILCLV